MAALLRASLAFYRYHPLQWVLAVLGIAMGVAAVSAMQLVQRQAAQAYQQSLNNLYGPATHEIVAIEGHGVDEKVYASWRRRVGMPPMTPVIEGDLRVADETLHLVGIDPFAARSIGQFSGALSAASPARFMLSRQAVAMSEETATRLRIAQGDLFDGTIAGQRQRLFLLTTWAGDGWDASWVVADIANVQVWLKQTGYVSRVLLSSTDEKELALVALSLPPTMVLRPLSARQTSARMSGAFYANLQAMGLLAWLLGVFLAYSAYALLSRQRRTEFAWWRTLGVTQGELTALLLIEALGLGLIGGVLGIGVGHSGALLLLPVVTQTGAALYGEAIVANVALALPWQWLILGPVAALLAAIPLIREIRALAPVELGQTQALPVATSDSQVMVFAGIGLLGLAAVILRTTNISIWLSFAALFFLFAGYALLTPRFLRGLLLRLPGRDRFSRALLLAHIQRQGMAQSALVIALAAGMGLAWMVSSFRGSVVDWLDQVLWADLYVSASSDGQSRLFDESLLRKVAALPAVKQVGGLRYGQQILTTGKTVSITAYAMDVETIRSFPLLSGAVKNAAELLVRGKGVYLNETLARRLDLHVGDVIGLRHDSGDLELPVLAVNANYSVNDGAVVMAWHWYSQQFDDAYFDALGVNKMPNMTVDDLREQMLGLLPADGLFRWTEQQRIRQRSLEVFDQTFQVTEVGRLLVLVIALVAIFGAMTAMLLAQSPWLRLLRALGVTPKGMMVILFEQSLLLGLMAGVLAIPLGMIVSWVLTHKVMLASFGWLLPMHLDGDQVFVVLAQATIVAILATLYPASRVWRLHGLARMS